MIKPFLKLFSMFLIMSGSFYSCAPARFVKPLEEGEQAVAFNAGGPLIGFAGTTIPVPFTALTYGKGISENTTAFGSLHLTSLAYGNVQTDIGVVREIYAQDTAKPLLPGISLTPAVNLVYGTFGNQFKIWPQFDMNFYWNIHQNKNFFYAGISNWLELGFERAHGERQQKHWIFNPHAGIFGRSGKWNSSLEVKYIAPNVSNKDMVVDYRSIGPNGAIGVYYTLMRRF
jgi:hypothetical protein